MLLIAKNYPMNQGVPKRFSKPAQVENMKSKEPKISFCFSKWF